MNSECRSTYVADATSVIRLETRSDPLSSSGMSHLGTRLNLLLCKVLHGVL